MDRIHSQDLEYKNAYKILMGKPLRKHTLSKGKEKGE
jgi:hypothetical protein